MLGFSLSKLLVLAAVIALVWYLFKLVDRRNRLPSKKEKSKPVPDSAQESRLDDAQDMEKCAKCGTFVPNAAARDCGRDECPYPP
jgi:hypothetical protein